MATYILGFLLVLTIVCFLAYRNRMQELLRVERVRRRHIEEESAGGVRAVHWAARHAYAINQLSTERLLTRNLEGLVSRFARHYLKPDADPIGDDVVPILSDGDRQWALEILSDIRKTRPASGALDRFSRFQQFGRN